MKVQKVQAEALQAHLQGKAPPCTLHGYVSQLLADRDAAREDRDILQQRLAKEQRGRNHVCQSLSSAETTAAVLEMDLRDAKAERDDARGHACRLMWERDEAQTAFLEMMALAEDANDSLEEAVVLLEKVLESSDKLDAAKWLFGLRLQQGIKAIRARIEKETYDPHEAASIGYEVDRGGDDD